MLRAERPSSKFAAASANTVDLNQCLLNRLVSGVGGGAGRVLATRAAAVFAHLFRSGGAPRQMKMGTIASTWRYDAAVCRALQSVTLRRPAILRYA